MPLSVKLHYSYGDIQLGCFKYFFAQDQIMDDVFEQFLFYRPISHPNSDVFHFAHKKLHTMAETIYLKKVC